jgi:hypothetical protein
MPPLWGMGDAVTNTKIRNMDAYDRGIWDWKILEGCFGETSVTPTDVDALIQRRDKFLFIETKQPGAPVPPGQKYALEHLAKYGDTVLIVHGSEKEVTELKKMTYAGEHVYEKPSIDKLRSVVAGWWNFANEPPSPERMAEMLRKAYGPDFCDRLMAAFIHLAEKG